MPVNSLAEQNSWKTIFADKILGSKGKIRGSARRNFPGRV